MAAGTAATRIVLGGFGQGGAVALTAGRYCLAPRPSPILYRLHHILTLLPAALQCPHRLGGVVALSAWLPAKMSKPHKANRALQALLLHGRNDEIVYPAAAEASAQALRQLGASVEVEYFDDLDHTTCHPEVTRLADFMSDLLPEQSAPANTVADDDDMSEEAKAVWQRLVAESEAEEQAAHAAAGDPEVEIPIDDTTVDLVETAPDAVLLTHIHRAPGEHLRPVYGDSVTVSFRAVLEEDTSQAPLQQVERFTVVLGSEEVGLSRPGIPLPHICMLCSSQMQ